MIDSSYGYASIEIAFAGEPTDAIERTRQAMQRVGLIGNVEGPVHFTNATGVMVTCLARDGDELANIDSFAHVLFHPAEMIFTPEFCIALGAVAVLLDGVEIYVSPTFRPPEELRAASQLFLAGPKLCVEDLICLSRKDETAKWQYWNDRGTFFARYTGLIHERRPRNLSFPTTSGPVIALRRNTIYHRHDTYQAELHYEHRRIPLCFADKTVAISDYAPGSEAGLRYEDYLLLRSWVDDGQGLDMLSNATGSQVLGNQLLSGIRAGKGETVLEELQQGLGIAPGILSWLRQEQVPAGAHELVLDSKSACVEALQNFVQDSGHATLSGFASRKRLRKGAFLY